MSLLFWILMNLPRLSYPMEWQVPGVVRALGDDYYRLAELISMTLSPSFPLQHYLNQDYLFSFYYCSLIPFAVLKLLIPFITIKDAIFLGNLIYSYLIVFSLLEVALLFFRTRFQVRLFLFLCSFFGGLDWIFFPLLSLQNFEWWQKYSWFRGNTQISSFYTTMFWTIHHFAAFYSLILFFVVARFYRVGSATKKTAVIFLLLIHSFYSSIFAFLPVLALLWIERKVVLHRARRSPIVTVLAFLLLLSPMFLYLGKVGSQHFVISSFNLPLTKHFWIDKALGFPLYLTLIPLVEFCGIPLMLLAIYKQFSAKQRAYFLCSFFFFVLTDFVAYSGFNNFCMRGMLLPTWIFFFLFATHISQIPFQKAKLGAALLLILGSVGVLKPMMYQSIQAVYNYRNASVGNPAREIFHQVARTPELQSNPVFQPSAPYALPYFYCEKMMFGVRLQDMEEKDKELLGLPK